MPYVNKLNVRGTQFDIRDEEARTEIEALKKKTIQMKALTQDLVK